LGDLLSKQPVAPARLTIAALAAAIARNPEDAQSHNNMAWLLAICPDAKLRDPGRAVKLRRHAATDSGTKPKWSPGTISFQ
jgi:hypothetical protein